MRWLSIIMAMLILPCLVITASISNHNHQLEIRDVKQLDGNSKDKGGGPFSASIIASGNDTIITVPYAATIICHYPGNADQESHILKIKKIANRPNPDALLNDYFAIAGIVLFGSLGLVYIFGGFVLSRITIFISSFLLGTYGSYQIWHALPLHLTISNAFIITFSVISGLVLVGISVYSFTTGMYFISCLASYLFVIYVWTFFSHDPEAFTTLPIRDFIALAFPVFCCFLLYYFESFVIMCSVSFIGVYFIALAFDVGFQFGIFQALETTICIFDALPEFSPFKNLFQILVAILTALSICLHRHFLGGRRFGLNIERIDGEVDEEDATKITTDIKIDTDSNTNLNCNPNINGNAS